MALQVPRREGLGSGVRLNLVGRSRLDVVRNRDSGRAESGKKA